MVTNPNSLEEIESGLMEGLAEHERARVRGDWYENALWVHTALDAALNYHRGTEAEDKSFPEKFKECLPDLYDTLPVENMNKCRNLLGHPTKRHPDRLVWQTSVDMANLATAAWRPLFGSDPPPVRHPEFDPYYEATVRAAPGPAPEPASPWTAYVETPVAAPAPAPWWRRPTAFFGAVALLILMAAAFGLGQGSIPDQPARIEVGGRVQVTAPARVPLLVRAAPAHGQAEVAHYFDDDRLTVMGGPVTTDMCSTWWNVRGPDGKEGWTVANFLEPVGNR